MYARPSIGGETLDFGVSGKLWRRTLVLYDRQTATLWSQHDHRAIAGPLAGVKLEVLASEITSWRRFQAAHPESTVLVKPPAGREWKRLAAAAALVVAALAFRVVYRRLPTISPGPS